MIVEELLQSKEKELKKRQAVDVRIGIRYTGVLLGNGNLGVARSFQEEATKCCEVIDEAGDLEDNAYELAKLALEPYPTKASIGIATINSIYNQNTEGEKGGLMDFLKIKDGDKIGMVGNFKPILNKIDKDIEISIFERNPQEEGILPDYAAEQILPHTNIAIITGSTVVNKTIDHLLEITKNVREVALLGPTTPLAPSVFGNYGVTLLAGMVVEDVEKGVKVISQGGGTRKLGEFSRKVSIKL